MKIENIVLGKSVIIDPSSSINNVMIGDNVKIAKRCSIYGSESFQLEIGDGTYIGMNTILNGFVEKLKVGARVSIAQNVNIMVDSGPNASELLQEIYPMIKGPVIIGDDCWIGANAVIMPNVSLGKCCVVAANSFVNGSFGDYCLIAGCPARLVKNLK